MAKTNTFTYTSHIIPPKTAALIRDIETSDILPYPEVKKILDEAATKTEKKHI